MTDVISLLYNYNRVHIPKWRMRRVEGLMVSLTLSVMSHRCRCYRRDLGKRTFVVTRELNHRSHCHPEVI
jgi:hypothetical protein